MYTWSTEYTFRQHSNQVGCMVDVTGSSGSVTIASKQSDLRSALVIGDRVHATPYWRRIVESPVVSGNLGLVAKFGIMAGGACGGKHPKEEVEGVITPAFFASSLLPPSMSIDAELDSFLSGSSITKALAACRSGYNNIPLLIAERRQTLDMITKRSRQIANAVAREQADALERYRKAVKRDRRRLANDIASGHLEVLFGFLPLIGEIEGLCDQLSAEKSVFITGRGRMRNVVTESDSGILVQRNIGINNNISHLTVKAKQTTIRTRNASARTSLRYEVLVEASQRLRNNGFNPVAVAYDLVPLSFLSDFVSNLGMWLRAHDPMFGARYVTGSTMLLYEDTVDHALSGHSYNYGWWNVQTTMAGSVAQSGKYYRRSVHQEPPQPVLLWQNNLTPGKLATAAALVIQRYLKPAKTLLKVRQFRYKGPRPTYLPPIRYRRQ